MRKETINIQNRDNKYTFIKKFLSLFIIFLYSKNDEFKYTGRLN